MASAVDTARPDTAETLVEARAPNRLFRNTASKLACTPMIATVLVVFIGCTLWTIFYSLTTSRVLPASDPLGKDFVGLAQYVRLFKSSRWIISVENIAVFGILTLVFVFAVGFLLAVLMDQKIRFENTFRTIFLYPFALSFVITGLVWQWMLNPAFGLQKSIRDLGWESFNFDWIANRKMVVYTLAIAAVWQGTGLVMALMLAGLRGVDDEIWKASRVDGIPKWRTYVSIVVPMMRPVFVTALVIVAAGIVRTYDLVVAMTGGGPGLSSQVPTIYVYEHMFVSNLSQGLAASTVMLATVAIIVVPWAFYEFGRRRTQ
ncbi:MAG: sugar ABC transporter permease [Bauldia sp.]|nr:MAG: sugar ABC transporter permease [Bauldia sp.]MBZ0227002.1 sugar ABC transporter permease [Bauldia sp.]